MDKIKTQIGKSASADFEDCTWTFLMPERYDIRAGEFAIVDKPIFDEMISALKAIRVYFGNNDKTIAEHQMYSLADRAIKANEL